MDGKIIFRCQFNGRKFSILEQDNPKQEGKKIYWNYEGRRRLDAFSWDTLGGAIGSLLVEYSPNVINELGWVWL